MPISVAELERNEARAIVEIGGQTGYVVYTPYSITPDVEIEIAELEKQYGKQSALAKFLSAVVVEWDVEKDGAVVPIEYEAMCGVPTVILGAVLGAVTSNLAPGRDEGKASGGASSSRMMTNGNSPIGTPASSRRATSEKTPRRRS